MLLSDRIERLAPSGATHYRLTLRMPGGVERSYPAEAGSFFVIGRAPGMVPDGHYTIRFYDQALQRIGDSDRELVIDTMAGVQSPPPQRALDPSDVRSGAAMSVARGGSGDSGLPSSRSAMSTQASRQEFRERYLAEKDPERRRQLLDADAEERQMAFIKNSTYARELGEVFLLNRMMRRELLQLHGTIVESSASAYSDLDQVKAAVRGLSEMQKEVLDHVRAQLASVDQSPPPPDYVGLGMAALATVQEIGQALLDRPSPGATERAATSTGTAPTDPSSSRR